MCFIFVSFAIYEVQAILGLQFLEDLSLYVFVAPLVIFGILDSIINREFAFFPWNRKDADEEVVNDERDNF
ncbi:hypothetical protein OAI42_00595 [bacterium]|nr:hypothetical protein [bacterium]